jgi:poly(A) polymerase
MSESGILVRVLGGVPQLASFENMAKVEAACGAPADPVQRFGALAMWLSEDAERLFERLRLSNAEHERLVSMGEAWWRIVPSDEKAARALLYRVGPQKFTDRVLIAWARSREGAADKAWKTLAELPRRWTAPVFPLRSGDFVSRGVVKGPALGIAMRAAEEAWIGADFPSDQAAIDVIASAAIKS